MAREDKKRKLEEHQFLTEKNALLQRQIERVREIANAWIYKLVPEDEAMWTSESLENAIQDELDKMEEDNDASEDLAENDENEETLEMGA